MASASLDALSPSGNLPGTITYRLIPLYGAAAVSSQSALGSGIDDQVGRSNKLSDAINSTRKGPIASQGVRYLNCYLGG